jgi:hypothetical protein
MGKIYNMDHTRVNTLTLPLVPNDGHAPVIIRVCVANANAAPSIEGGVPTATGTRWANYVQLEFLPPDLKERVDIYLQAMFRI